MILQKHLVYQKSISSNFKPIFDTCTKGNNQIYGPDIIGSYGPQQEPCPGGTYTDVRGTKQRADCKPCEEGYYCPQGSPEMVACPLGFYCPDSVAKPIPCDEGTFGEQLFLTDADECTPCTKGYYCGSKGLLQPSNVCDPGRCFKFLVNRSVTTEPKLGILIFETDCHQQAKYYA